MSVLNSGKVKSKLGFNVKALTSANIPNASQYNGQIIYLSDIGIAGSYWISNGTFWSPVGGEVTLAQSGTTVTVTGTTSETILATYTLPAGLTHPNSIIEINHLWSYTNSANNKSERIRLGGIAGDVYYSNATTTTATLQGFTAIRCNNSNSAQKGFGTGSTVASGLGTISAVLKTSTRDFATSSNNIVITGGLTLGTESLSLYGYSIILRG